MTSRSIEAALADSTERWMALPGVVGTAIGVCDGKPCIKVYVTEEADVQAIPASVEGHPVAVERTGPFEAR